MIDLLAYASGTRWFGSRPAELLGVSLTDWWKAAPGPGEVGVRSAFLDVVIGDEEARFHLPLGYVPPGSSEAPPLGREVVDGREFDVVDALDDHRCRLALLDCFSSGAPGFETTLPFPAVDPTTRRFGGEQSNTTVMYGTGIMMKVFRRVASGPNPDLECHRALAGTGSVAALYGRWHQADQDLALAVELLPDPVDGYDEAVSAARAGLDFSVEAGRLGTLLRTVHQGLARSLGTGVLNGDELRSALLSRLDEAVAEAPELGPLQNDLAAHYDDLPGGALPAQRIHGDCHLGQAILSDRRWFLVDFEGEPLVPIDQRRRMDLAVRDVAGMLRSFGYAADGAQSAWLEACRSAFLEGYGALTDAEGRLLRALEIDKACYEVRYERRYRPHLVNVPLGFLATVVT